MNPKYGNTGCGVFKQGIQNYKDFCLRINITSDSKKWLQSTVVLLAIVQKVYEQSSCPFAKMIPQPYNHFGKRTA